MQKQTTQTLQEVATQSLSSLQSKQGPLNSFTPSQATIYFFMRLTRAYGPDQMNHTFGGDKLLSAQKEWSSKIDALHFEQMNDGFVALQELRIKDPKNNKWPDIPLVINLCRNAGKSTHPSHRDHPALKRLPKPAPTFEQVANNLGELAVKRKKWGV